MLDTLSKALRGYTDVPTDVSLDNPWGKSDHLNGVKRAQQLRAILRNILTYSLPPLIFVALYSHIFGAGSSRNSSPDLVGAAPYACYANGQMVEATTLNGVCSANPPPAPGSLVEIGLDRHLTQEQCDAFFPGLYFEIDRAADYWKQRGGISRADLKAARDKSDATVIIQDNRMYVSEFKGGINSRTKAMLAGINEAVITATDKIPSVEFSIKTFDSGDTDAEVPLWVMSRTDGQQEHLWIAPDFAFNSWPEPGMGSFLETQDQTLDYESKQSWSDKLPILFWRGALMVDIRRQFRDVASKYSWGNVDEIHWDHLDGELRTPAEHCQYKFLGHVEGWAYSGHLKYLLQCRSVTVAHPLTYTQHFHHLMDSDPISPNQNIVITGNRDWSDLPQAMEDLLNNDARAERIANHSYQFWRYWLSSASINCYWRRMFQVWAEQLNEPIERPADAPSYASFNLMGKTQWSPA